jgi:hypothetical protein
MVNVPYISKIQCLLAKIFLCSGFNESFIVLISKVVGPI